MGPARIRATISPYNAKAYVKISINIIVTYNFSSLIIALAPLIAIFPIPIPDPKHANPTVNPEYRYEYASCSFKSSIFTKLADFYLFEQGLLQ